MARSENNPSPMPPPDEGIQSPYDRLINRTLQQVESARSLLEFHLPRELVQHLNLDTLAHVDTSLIDRNLRRRFADRLFSVEVSEQEVALRPVLQLLAQTMAPDLAKNLLDTIRIYVMSVNPVMGEEKMNEMVTEFWPVKPEPGSVADQLLQKGRAQGEEIGEARGEVRGHAHTVRILQSVLGIPQTSD